MSTLLLKNQILLLLFLHVQIWKCSVIFLESKKYLPVDDGNYVNLHPYIDSKSFTIGNSIPFFIDFTFKDVILNKNFVCEQSFSCFRTGKISTITYNEQKIEVETIRLFLGISKPQSSSFQKGDIEKIAILEAYHIVDKSDLRTDNIVGLNQQSTFVKYISQVYIIKESFLSNSI